MAKSRSSFGGKLERWRKDAGRSQQDLEASLGKGRAWVSRLESGKVTPPDKATCTLIGQELGVPDEEVWEAAATERLQDFDPDLLEYLRQEVRKAGETVVDEWESYVIEALRHIGFAESEPDFTECTANLLEGFAYGRPSSGTRAAPPRTSLVKLVRSMHAADANSLGVFLATMALWAEALPRTAPLQSEDVEK